MKKFNTNTIQSIIDRVNKRAVVYTAVCGVLSTLLLSITPVAMATPQDNTAENWDEWKSLSSGYVGRRKIPAKFDLPKSERRFESVQEKGSKNKKDKKGDTLSLDASLTASAAAVSIDALWVRTGAEGLYSVSIAELASQLGESEKSIQKKAKQGGLTITNAGESVAWNYDVDAQQILFVGEEYNTFYTAENAYHFSANRGDQAQQMGDSGKNVKGVGSPTPFDDTLHFEEEPDMFYSVGSVPSRPDADYWWWDYLFSGFIDLIEVALNVPNPAPNGTAQLRVRLGGWTDIVSGDDHQVYAELNGMAVGSAVAWDGFNEALLVADFDQSLLNPSGNNTLHLRNIYDAGTHTGQWLDDIEIDYSRMPVAENDALWVHNVTGGVQTVSGFSSSEIRVIQSPISNSSLHNANITSDGVGGYSVTFKATGGEDYLVTANSAIVGATVEIDIPSDLANSGNSADYLIITAREFSGTAEALANYRSSYGTTRIVWMDEIYDEFNHGRVDPHAVTQFMNHVQQNWLYAPSVVVLVGKGTLDEKDRMGYGDSFVPIIFTDTPWSLAASDDRLLGGNGDAPFAIGRIPITNDDEGMAYVNKVIAYESLVPGDERYQAVLVADNPDSAGDFHTNSDLLATRLTDTLDFDGVTKLYHPDDAVRTNLTASDTWETGYVSYDGHGGTWAIGDGPFLNSSDAVALSNTAFPVFTALTCAAGNHILPAARSLVGALVLNPSGGAIASMAPTGLSLDYDAQQMGNAFVDSLYGNNSSVGEAVKLAKAQTLGSVNSFMQRMYTVIGDPVVYGR